jgi:nucleotide-binding universal stress UspA family protein
MELPFVVGVDGSDSSLVAVDWATDEAARYGLPLRLVYASLCGRHEGFRPSGSLQRPSSQVSGDDIVASAVDRAQHRNPEVKVFGDVLPEDPVVALLHESDNATALVTGCRGRGELDSYDLAFSADDARGGAVYDDLVTDPGLHAATRCLGKRHVRRPMTLLIRCGCGPAGLASSARERKAPCFVTDSDLVVPGGAAARGHGGPWRR